MINLFTKCFSLLLFIAAYGCTNIPAERGAQVQCSAGGGEMIVNITVSKNLVPISVPRFPDMQNLTSGASTLEPGMNTEYSDYFSKQPMYVVMSFYKRCMQYKIMDHSADASVTKFALSVDDRIAHYPDARRTLIITHASRIGTKVRLVCSKCF